MCCGILEGRASQTGEQEEQRHWSVSVLGLFAGTSREARGLELILGWGGSSRELGQSGSQRTLYPERLERWKLLSCVFLFFEKQSLFIKVFTLRRWKQRFFIISTTHSKYSSLYVPSFIYSFLSQHLFHFLSQHLLGIHYTQDPEPDAGAVGRKKVAFSPSGAVVCNTQHEGNLVDKSILHCCPPIFPPEGGFHKCCREACHLLTCCYKFWN